VGRRDPAPALRAAEIERVRANWLAGIKQEKTQPG
jgi:hypothetical protein